MASSLSVSDILERVRTMDLSQLEAAVRELASCEDRDLAPLWKEKKGLILGDRGLCGGLGVSYASQSETDKKRIIVAAFRLAYDEKYGKRG